MTRRCIAVVLNFETSDSTLEAVRSLRESQRPLDEIVVVDNGSRDGSAARLKTALGSAATLLENRSNRASPVDAMLAFDARWPPAPIASSWSTATRCCPRVFGRLEAALDTDPALGIVGPAIVTRAAPLVALSLGMSCTPATGRMRNLGFGEPYNPAAHRLRPVKAVSGCVMLVDRRVFAQVGLFDEDRGSGVARTRSRRNRTTRRSLARRKTHLETAIHRPCAPCSRMQSAPRW